MIFNILIVQSTINHNLIPNNQGKIHLKNMKAILHPTNIKVHLWLWLRNSQFKCFRMLKAEARWNKYLENNQCKIFKVTISRLPYNKHSSKHYKTKVTFRYLINSREKAPKEVCKSLLPIKWQLPITTPSSNNYKRQKSDYYIISMNLLLINV